MAFMGNVAKQGMVPNDTKEAEASFAAEEAKLPSLTQEEMEEHFRRIQKFMKQCVAQIKELKEEVKTLKSEVQELKMQANGVSFEEVDEDFE